MEYTNRPVYSSVRFATIMSATALMLIAYSTLIISTAEALRMIPS